MKKIVYILFGFMIAQSPISDAGADQVVQLGEQVQLDGSNSYDLDGSISSYSWSSSDGISLTGASTATPTFTAPSSSAILTFNLIVTDNDGLESVAYPSEDIFISEYSEGSSPHQYIELYNGTSESINLTDYEIWLVKGGSSMSWDEPDRILVFNKDSSSDVDLDPDFDDIERADPSDLEPGETLMILREAEDEEFDFVGLNFVVFSQLSQLGGDDAIALRKCSDGQCESIDQVGEDTDPGTAWEVAGVSNATKNHTLIRKGIVISGNTDWASSAGTNSEDSEWIVNDEDTFDDVFNHSCTSCDDQVVVYVSSPPVASPSIISDGLLLDSNGEICDTEITLDASSSTTLTGDISYQWIDSNNLLDDDDLTKKQPNFSTIGVSAGTYEFGLVVFDGLLESTESIVSVTISSNLCPHASSSVVLLSDGNWIDQYPSLVLFENENFTDMGDGLWNQGETFYDVGDFMYTEGEDYIDVNGNGQWDGTEPFIDMGDGVYTEGEQFDDIGNGVYDEGEDFIDMNGNEAWDDSQVVYLSGLGSIDPDEGDLTYSWDEISGILAESEIISVEDDRSVVSFTRPDFGDEENGELQFTLSVHDGSESSLVDTLTVKFGRPSQPVVPFLSVRSEHQQVILSWDSYAEESEDYLTGYFDFEGYKLYKSLDGGETWGTDSDKIYDDTGAFVAWKPFRQWDLTQEEDESHCNYSSDYCSENNRNINVSGYDPYSYWINIGENNGLAYSFVDTSVVDGVEYTYALTSYDTGIWTTYQDPASGEILWYESNPNQFIDLDGNGFPTMESEIDIEGGKNFITITPGYYAGNIDFPDPSLTDIVFTADPSNYGNALVEYELVNLDELEPVKILFEVQAEEEDYNNFEGLSTKNPRLYAYYLSEDGSPLESSSIPYSGLLNVEIDSLLDLPGTYIDTDENMIVQPEYAVEDMEIMYIDDLGNSQNFTDFLSGTRMMFTNPWREYGHSVDILNISDPDNIMFYEGTGSDYYAPIIGESYLPGSDTDEDLSRRINYNLKFNYDNTQTTFNNRPPYRYQIEFSKTAEHEAFEVLQEASASADYSCQNSETNTMLPFRVKNLTTGEYVGLRHIDQGFNNGGDADQPLYAPAGGCEDEGFDSYVGDCDCVWTMYEDVIFVEDIVTTKYNTTPHAETTYSLELSYDFFVLMNFLNADPWNENFAYDEGKYVIYGQTKWLATTDINPGVTPGSPYDPDNDGIDNGNPWQAVYPWSNFDADEISLIIEPWTWFSDGDKWVADLSQLGVETNVSSKMLSEVTVSPNPYMRHSGYNESSGEHKLKFSKLPTECEINIYTVSGERVRTIQFQDSGYYGNYFWDQKSGNGDLVGPGLYIYTIEDKNYKNKHIGKFAIVR